MKKIIITLALLFLKASGLYAQQFNVWAIPDGGAGVDFNSNPPQAITTSLGGFGEAAASVSDASGQLLFYTEGSFVWDRNNNLMPNGSDLTPIVSANNYSPTSSTSQGTLIVPMPDSAGKYYVFSNTSWEQYQNRGRLYYSIVNMELNGGLGDVASSRKGILVDSALGERMIGVVGDRCNVWVLVNVLNEAKYKAYEITEAGLNPVPVISNTGNPHYLPAGSMSISPDRKLLATAALGIFGSGSMGLQLSSFDPATGIVSNSVQLDSSGTGYGTCFSPDNTKLYYSSETTGQLRQYDVTAGNAYQIALSRQDLGPVGFTQLQLAPDGHIYFASGNNSLGAILNPNNSGAAAQYTANAISLLPGTMMYSGLPNQVPVFHRDTLLTTQQRKAGCFATEYPIRANNDTTGWGYVWNDGTAGPGLQVSAPGTYWVTYHTAPCVHHTDTFRVSMPGGMLPVLSLSNSCAGDSNGKAWLSTFAGDTVSYTYAWRNTAGDTLSTTDSLLQVPSGPYTVYIATASCDTILSFFLDSEEHHVNFTGDTLICLGSTVTFQNTSDSHFTQFSWFFGDGGQSAAAAPAYTYTQAGSYRVLLTGEGAVCRDSLEREIVVDEPVQDLSFSTDRDSICTGEAFLFYPYTDSTTTGLVWNFDGSDPVATGNAAFRRAFDRPGHFAVVLTARFRACPELSFRDSVIVHPLPLVNLGPDTTLCLNGKPVTLTDLTAADGERFLWTTGADTRQIEVRHHGLYRLTVTNRHGCTNSESITVKKGCYIDIPNAFTPNGDGVNDYFFPRQELSAQLSRFRMAVFNRWGQQIFGTERTDGRGWDGKFNGSDQPQGVYLYRIEVEIDGQHTEHYTGNVTLIR